MIAVSEREIARYLGYHGYTPDERIQSVIDEVLDELQRVSLPRSMHRIEPFQADPDGLLHLGPILTDSRDLYRNLAGCSCVILLGATLGAGADHVIRRYEKTDILKAVIAQACASAMIEAYADQVQETLREEASSQGLYMRPRYSPGYGDFPLAVQPQFLQVLELSKRIGIMLTDGMLMTPSKSITAVIGLSSLQLPCRDTGCALCAQESCPFRQV